MIKAALGLPMMTKTWHRAREGLFASRPTVYICVILVAALLSYAYWLRTYSIFSCQAGGYDADRYLAYCHGAGYGDYEHGAFEFDLEPSAQKFVRNADVLFLGNSRLQVAFSTVATGDWFAAASARYYLMGFTYFENVVFAERLLRRIRPRARVYVINVDDFFDRSETEPVTTILHDPEARKRYEGKRFWQRLHEPICQRVALLCGGKWVIFRSRETGAYYMHGAAEQKIVPVSYHQVINHDVVSRYDTATALYFLSHFTQGRCVILTMIPFVGTEIGNANAVAEGVGAKLVAPEIPEGLQTFDGSHLDQPSAQRWSQAFFQAAGPKIRSCLAEPDLAHPQGSSLQSPIAH